MLEPDYLNLAGEKTAAVYTQIESEMLAYLVERMLKGDIANQRSQTALLSISQSNASQLLAILNKYKGQIDSSVADEVTEALKTSDADDLRRIKQGMGVDLPAITTRQIAATVAGVRDILARDNLDMVQSAQNLFLTESIWAITQVNTGAMTTERALHEAVRRITAKDLSIISYRNTETGKQTVRNHVDVAVRRHIRTQILQDSMSRTEQILDDAGVELVEVSSHVGSRPSHAEWEGKVYSRHGDKVIDGVKYKDFRTACKWGDVANGIGGANCRHSYAAYFPGMKRQFEPNPKHPSGKSNEEVYKLTQQQRQCERDIRQAKRDLKTAEEVYKETPLPVNQVEVSKAKIKLQKEQAKIRKLINDNPNVLQRSPRREWAGDMPKIPTKKELRSYYSGVRKSSTPKWTNPDIEKLSTSDEIATYIQSKTGATVTEEFKQLPISDQKEVAVGIADAIYTYGETDINTITTMKSKSKDGSYDPDRGTVRINENASSFYLASYHETIHGIDAKKSSTMPKFDTTHNGEEYNLYSIKILKEARKAVGLSRASNKYNDAVLQLMDMNLDLFNSERTKPYEIVAYALDYEAQGKSNVLSRAIAERF